jgi:hypothetical protein
MSASDDSVRFWPWFQANGDRLLDMMYGTDDDARAAAFDELREAFEEIQPGGLLIELARPPGAPTKEFIVSADGRPERVDLVKDFVEDAPPLDGWTVVPFRRRMPADADLEISIQGETVARDDVWFELADAEGGLDLTLFVRDLTEENERFRGMGASLLAEHTIGELDSFTLLNSLNVQPLPDDPANSGYRPFTDLTAAFDAIKRRKYPPPGQLPLNEDRRVGMVKGQIGGAPAFGRVMLALKAVMRHPAYDRALLVRIAYREVGPNGIPSSQEEFDEVGELSDAITEALEKDQQSLLATAITGRGQREMTFYTHDAVGALERLDALRAAGVSHSIDADVERDTFWGYYQNFVSGQQEEE